MWQAPSQRIRAMAMARRRARERQKFTIHVKAVEGDLKLQGEHPDKSGVPIRVILNDLSPKGVGIFASQPFETGQDVLLTIQKPQPHYIHAKIAWCQEHNANSHVLSKNSYSYRIGLVFVFQNPDEEQKIKAYCEELSKGYLYGVPAYAAFPGQGSSDAA